MPEGKVTLPSGIYDVVCLVSGTLVNVMQAEAWKVPGTWDLSSLALVENPGPPPRGRETIPS